MPWPAGQGAHAADAGAWMQSFVDSQFEFRRTSSNAPYLQLAWLDATHYGDTTLLREDGSAAGCGCSERMPTFEGGVSGFRDFGFVGSDWRGPNSSNGTSPYVSLRFGFRPPALSPAQ